jgi:hypothetical protein
MSAIVLAVMFYGYLVKDEPLISWRNFFLLGFLQFYTLATLWSCILDFQSNVYITRGEAFGTLALAMPLFFFTFLATWAWAKKWQWPHRIVPRMDLPITTGGVLTCAVLLIGLVILSIPLGGGSYADSLVFFVRTSMGAAATGLAFYLLLSNPRNPVWWAVFGGIFIVAAITSVVGSIDRRNFLSVFFVVAWMWYFSKLRWMPKAKTLRTVFVVAAVTFFCLVVYNKGRQQLGWQTATFEARGQQFLELAKTGPDLSAKNLLTELLLQDTPLNTVCIMENYPERYEHDPLAGAHFYIVNPIPRAVYPNKPEALGIILQRQLQVAANLGCGIIGHGWHEAAWIGILYYAIFFGALIAVVDNLVQARSYNPYFLAATGCSLGNVLGLPRGETSMFLDMITAGFFICLFLFTFAAYALRPYLVLGAPIVLAPAWAFPGDDQPEDDPADPATDYPAADGYAAAPAFSPQRDPDEP